MMALRGSASSCVVYVPIKSLVFWSGSTFIKHVSVIYCTLSTAHRTPSSVCKNESMRKGRDGEQKQRKKWETSWG